MKGPDFAVRGFEFCDNSRFQTGMWRWKMIDRALALMRQLDFNTFIFHQNDLSDWVSRPRAYFPPALSRARWPVRYANVENGKSHLREVIRKAGEQGVQFFIEVKEMSFPEELLEVHPEVMVVKGTPCPTHPFWWDFIRAKYREIVEDLPGLGGVIVSAGTRESKLSLAVHACPCERCRTYAPSDWYANIVRAIHEPLQARGKTLVVRDFAYDRTEQNLVVDACSRVSERIVVALKNTPHDFYPPFPDNPRIGTVGRHPQWIEFDAWCQFSGMGFIPVSVAGDIQRRLRHARALGAVGAMWRVDLELISDASVFNSLNLVNVFAAGMLARNVDESLDNIYDAWLAYGIADHLKPESEQPPPCPIVPAERGRFRRFMEASWNAVVKSLYVRGFIFTDGTCQFPFSVDHAFFVMLTFQGRDDWEPGASRRIAPTAENVEAVLREKQEAEAEVAALPGILGLETLTLPENLRASYRQLLSLYQLYVRGLARSCAACFRTRRAQVTRAPADVDAALRAAAELAAYGDEVERRLQGTYYPHYVYWYFDLGYLRRLAADAHAKAAALA